MPLSMEYQFQVLGKISLEIVKIMQQSGVIEVAVKIFAVKRLEKYFFNLGYYTICFRAFSSIINVAI